MSDSSQTIWTNALDEEFRSLYWEEVGKIVDGIVVEIRNGSFSTEAGAELQAKQVVAATEYVKGKKLRSLCVLLFSKFPCAGLSGYRNLPARLDNDFPFYFLALKAMQADVIDDLKSRSEYIGMSRLTQAKKTGRFSSAQPNEANIGKPKWKKSNPTT